MQSVSGVVVVVHYRREAELDTTLGQLRSLPASWQVIVVSNGTTDPHELGRIVTAHGAALIELDNPGYAAAVNVGVAAASASAEYLCVLTHEVRLSIDCLDALVGSLVGDVSLGLVGPTLWDSDSPGRIWSTGGDLTRIRRVPRNRRTAPVATSQSCSWVEGACWAMRLADLAILHGHDERYFLYMEDVDLGLRVGGTLGLRVECIHQAEAGQSSGGTMTTYLAVRNLLLLHRKFYPWLVPLDVLENLIRLGVGPLLRPKGWRDRAPERWRGLKAGCARQRRTAP